ncbi:hypothetical protein HH746_003191 [Escherichia coli]|nr:hypothetical protein [Escherichia coli]
MIFYLSFFQSSSDDWLLFEPVDNTGMSFQGMMVLRCRGSPVSFFKIIPVSYVHKCHKLHILCSWELPGTQ